MHRALDKSFPLPPADILLHTGDVSNMGTDAELADFNGWLGEIKDRYKHIVVITGNHDWIDPISKVGSGELAAADVLSPAFMQAKMPNAKVLTNSMVELEGLKIYGSGWAPWYGLTQPGDKERMEWSPARSEIYQAWSKGEPSPTHMYGDIPAGIDILMTHEPAWGFFDASWAEHWGSSKELRAHIERAKPKAHLFGHVHEQRGVWERSADGTYASGVEYEPAPGKPYKPRLPPPAGYPVQLVANTALENNPGIDRSVTGVRGIYHIVAPGRLITATAGAGGVTFAAAASEQHP
uniref:Calcineurin-like phosphoesterase domain-containing protein n=1 Tax=Alexandrium catenella TaxID=2925 RepID=A0A7S1SFF1_ALECA